MRPLGSAYLVSPCSSAPFRWGRRSCLGLRTGVSPHFSMNSMREILALRGGYERGRVPLPSPMPPESGAPPHNTHPSMVPPRHPRRSSPLFFVLAHTISFFYTHTSSSRSLLLIAILFFSSITLSRITLYYENIILHGITKLSRSPMITYDQVVSGSSAECMTKMAAAPAVDFVYSFPGSSSLFFYFFFFYRLSFFLLFRLPRFFSWLLRIRSLFSTLPISHRESFVSVFPTLIVSCALLWKKIPMRENA